MLARLVSLKTKNGYGLGICTECGQPFTEMKGPSNLPKEKVLAVYKYTSRVADELTDFLTLP